MSDWRQTAGRCLMVGIPGPATNAETERRVRALGPGGVILFRRNLESVAQARKLIRDLRKVSKPPILLAVDQEGGRVSRLGHWVGATPTAADLAAAGPAAVDRFARATAGALRALGFDLDFAPVVDLCAADATNGIGDRSFGTDPEIVRRLAGIFVEGLQASGVAACLKHFPGLGPTSVDSHAELPTADRTRSEIDAADLVPFRALGARAAAVMVGHGHYPALDDRAGRPATLSRAIVGGILTEELAYGGLVVSDDLEMGAVAPLDVEGRAAVEALAAGCDLVLYCSDLDRAEEAAAALASTAAADDAFATRLRDAAAKVERTAARWQTAEPAADAWERARAELESAATLA